jgi:PPP family 3-phenylpropionic acid transporter
MPHRVVISLVWFFALGGMGVFFPYYSLYLYENAGLRGTQIGAVLAMLPLVGIAAQPLWGWVGDRTGSRSRVLVLLALGAVFGYLGLYAARGFSQLLLGTAALALFSTALIPSSVSVTLALSRNAGPHAFGFARVWGTVGFLGIVVGFPVLLDAYQEAHGLRADAGAVPSEPALGIMFPFTAALLVVAGAIALALPRE